MISCVLTDIEGTTSSIEFVHKVLFPYSRSNFYKFLSTTEDKDVQAVVLALWTEHLGQASGTSADLARVAKLLQDWIDQDLKNSQLKALQGKIWRQGYEAKAYRGHVYADVQPLLERWKNKGLHLAVYSSGSVEAQKLLFKYSEAGDLTPLFSCYFDTGVGHKRDRTSYAHIAEKLKLDPERILFLSDIKEELDAAELTGFKTCQLMRDPLPKKGHHPQAENFKKVDQLFF